MYLLDHYCVYLQNTLFRAVGVIKIDGLVYDLRFTSIFTIPVITGRWLGDNERCGMEPRLHSKGGSRIEDR